MAKTKKNLTKKTGKRNKTGKRKMSPWNKFVKDVYAREKKNGKSFKECLVIAAKEKKQGKMKV
jgi:hypothetical protein